MAARKQKQTRTKLSLEEWEQIQKLTLMDNDFMNVALEGSIPCVEEIQRDDEGADPRRPRFQGAMLDTHALKAGQDFKALPERYIIFITQNDVLGLGRTAYVIHKYIEAGEELLPFDDGTHLVYVNGAATDDGTELWKLIHDLKCQNASEMYFPRLAERVKFLKEKEEGGEKMSSYFEEQRRKAVEATRNEDKQNFAMKLIQRGKDTLNEIAECTGLTLRQVRALARNAAV